MARRGRGKDPVEAFAGLIALIVFLAMFSPKFRIALMNFTANIIALAVIIGIIILIIYIIIQVKKSKEPSISSSMSGRARRTEPKVTFPEKDTFIPRKVQPQNTDIGDIGKSDSVGIQKAIQEFQDIIIAQRQSKPRQWDDTILKTIEWRRFEIVTKEFLNMSGFVATETKTGADGGVDITIQRKDNPESRGIVQCKAWNSYKVGIKVVRELFGVMAANRISMGMVITSGEFTSEAEDFAKGKMTLVSGDRFLELIRKLPEEQQQHLLDVALEGDYTTPTCPQCDIKMKLRESSKGRNAGGKFWGCVKYPRCKQTLVYKEA